MSNHAYLNDAYAVRVLYADGTTLDSFCSTWQSDVMSKMAYDKACAVCDANTYTVERVRIADNAVLNSRPIWVDTDAEAA